MSPGISRAEEGGGHRYVNTALKKQLREWVSACSTRFISGLGADAAALPDAAVTGVGWVATFSEANAQGATLLPPPLLRTGLTAPQPLALSAHV